MKRSILYVLALWVACLTTTAFASPSPPTRTVERLSFAREHAADQGTPFVLRSVKCAPTRVAYIYVCNFTGANAGKSLCAATYVHYHPGHTGKQYKVNFYGQAWHCGTRPPVAPPQYPGDGGPKS